MKNMKCRWAIAITLLLGLPAMAQHTMQSVLPAPANSGFYRVVLRPELTRYLKTDLSDLRLLDAKGVQVPFLLQDDMAAKAYDRTDSFTITSNTQNNKGNTLLVFDNPGGQPLQSLVLLIRNAEATRRASVSGSNNGREWFTVAEDRVLEDMYNAGGNVYPYQLQFPLSTYRHFRLTIENGRRDPLSIVSIVRPMRQTVKSSTAPLQNPAVRFTQKDSTDGYSYIRLVNALGDQTYRLIMELTGPKFYKRNVSVDGAGAGMLRSTDTEHTLEFGLRKDSAWTIRIENGDNPPLKIQSISTLQPARSMVTYLEKGNSYHLALNNPNAQAPQYELQEFRDSIPALMETLRADVPMPVTKQATAVVQAPKSNQRIWLWVALGAVLLVLLFFTIRMVREMEKKK